MSNSDIAVHNNEPEEVAAEVRNWLNSEASLSAPGPSRIWGAFNEFMAENYDELIANGFSKHNIERLPIKELMRYMKEWVKANT